MNIGASADGAEVIRATELKPYDDVDNQSG
jgi:hypothetical protein